jgi:hypothetical protein
MLPLAPYVALVLNHHPGFCFSTPTSLSFVSYQYCHMIVLLCCLAFCFGFFCCLLRVGFAFHFAAALARCSQCASSVEEVTAASTAPAAGSSTSGAGNADGATATAEADEVVAVAAAVAAAVADVAVADAGT